MNARKADGTYCHWSDPAAVQFDLEGALRRSGIELHQHYWNEFLISYYEDPETGKWKKRNGPLIANIQPHRNPHDWNDHPTTQQKHVILLLESIADHYRYQGENDD